MRFFVLNENNIIDEEIKEKSLLQLRNFFFIFNTTQQTSNKTDKIISAISYKVYNCETANEFKIVFSDFMYELESYILQKDYKLLFESNQSFKYSNKDTTMKRNNKLVKFVLEQICVKDQHDTKIDSNNLTIEHLQSDDGSLDNSSIWNLTLTTDQINSEELKNKEIKEKINILREKSTIRINQNLDKYLINGIFDFNKRKSDFLDLIFGEIFTFEPNTFNISKEEISLYKKQEKLLIKNNDPELMSILKENGTMFLKKLENDPKLKNLYDRFNNYIYTD